MVSRKTQYMDVNGTPQKRVFLSIINDYDLLTGLCELVDNAIDMWTISGRKKKLNIAIQLDSNRQLISVKDNAGGVKEENLEYLISPGATGLTNHDDTIGVFGVGGKRAGIALGELIEIKSRYKTQKSLQLDITREWLASEDWEIAVYEIPNIASNSTIVEISKLRQSFDSEHVESIKIALGEIYGRLLEHNMEISLNRNDISPKFFDIWAYPPTYPPKKVELTIEPSDQGQLMVSIAAGLIRDRDPEEENYGVYFYCNDRLIVKEVKSREVGYYITSEAGVPHPDASLCRVIVSMKGSPSLMPWNSSKSGINFSHIAFTSIRATLIDTVSFYSKLSRRLKSQWQEAVFKHDRGSIETVKQDDIKPSGKLIHPQLPSVRSKPFIEGVRAKNRKLIDDQPWTLGLFESLGIVETISRQKLDTKNRAALILLDSNLEIAFKEFIVNREDLFPPKIYPDTKIKHIFQSRKTVIDEVSAHIAFSDTQLRKISHYYGLRNKLIHERASVGITDTQIEDYRKLVEQVLKRLFGAKFPKRGSSA